jgi:hypothetical protein
MLLLRPTLGDTGTEEVAGDCVEFFSAGRSCEAVLFEVRRRFWEGAEFVCSCEFVDGASACWAAARPTSLCDASSILFDNLRFRKPESCGGKTIVLGTGGDGDVGCATLAMDKSACDCDTD